MSIEFYMDFNQVVFPRGEDGIVTSLPDDLENDRELVNLIDEVSDAFDALYINNAIEFTWKGFDSEEHRLRFIGRARLLIEMLKERCAGKYEFIEAYTPENMTMG